MKCIGYVGIGEEFIGNVYRMKDGRWFFTKADYKDGDSILYLYGMPNREDFIQYFMGNFNVMFDHRTSRRLYIAQRRIINKKHRAIRDQRRGKELLRRKALDYQGGLL